MTTKTASIIFGFVFILVGILGFIPNPIIFNSHDALFHADTIHSSIHIISGLLFLTLGWAAPHLAPTGLKIFGLVYLLLGVLGIIDIGTAENGMTTLLGFLCVNGPDNILHIALGALIFLAGMLKPTS